MEHIKPQSQGLYSAEPKHEKTDVNIPAVLAFGAALAVMAGIIYVTLFGLYKGLDKWAESQQAEQAPMMQQETKGEPHTASELAEQQQQAMQRLAATFPEPRLQPDEYTDMARMKADHDLQMSQYSWVNKETGAVRIPIDEAMKLIAQRGLPNVGPGPAPVAAGTAAAATPQLKKPAGTAAKK